MKKYDLKSNDAILVEEKHESIYDYVREKYEITYVAGGASQNAARAAQVKPKSIQAKCGAEICCNSSACLPTLVSTLVQSDPMTWQNSKELPTRRKVSRRSTRSSQREASQQVLALSSLLVTTGKCIGMAKVL